MRGLACRFRGGNTRATCGLGPQPKGDQPISIRSVIFWVGLHVHKESITAAVFQGRDPEPLRVDRIPNAPKRIRRYFERFQRPEAALRVLDGTEIAPFLMRRASVVY